MGDPSRAVRVTVRAKPRAKRSRVTRAEGLAVDVALAAPPVDGAANEALVALLSDVLSVPKRALTLVLGAASKHKVVEVSGLAEADVAARLAAAVS